MTHTIVVSLQVDRSPGTRVLVMDAFFSAVLNDNPLLSAPIYLQYMPTTVLSTSKNRSSVGALELQDPNQDYPSSLFQNIRFGPNHGSSTT